jgi:hypothetical protein
MGQSNWLISPPQKIIIIIIIGRHLIERIGEVNRRDEMAKK